MGNGQPYGWPFLLYFIPAISHESNICAVAAVGLFRARCFMHAR
jgi:hypothetical protein